MTESEMIAALERLSKCMGKIIHLVNGLPPMDVSASDLAVMAEPPEDPIAAAQALMRSLKDGLYEEVHQRSTGPGRARMSQIEEDCYYPAICEARSKIVVRRNSIPGPKWSSALCDAKGSIDLALEGLKSAIQS